MSHEAYAPVGYSYQAAHYCLDCIPVVASRCNEHKGQNCSHSGYKPKACNCAECRLDRMAALRGITRMNEGSFDMDDFPKHIPYHNDLHAECGPQYYGYGPDDPEWAEQYCGATCSECHEVIDGVSKIGGPDVCPVFDNREMYA
jgi:hypothetical protein